MYAYKYNDNKGLDWNGHEDFILHYIHKYAEILDRWRLLIQMTEISQFCSYNKDILPLKLSFGTCKLSEQVRDIICIYIYVSYFA